jgi:hypothetical protein
VDVPPHNDLAVRILPIPIISTNTRRWEHLVRKQIVLLFFIGIYKDDVRLDEFTDIGISFFGGHNDWDDPLSISAQVVHRHFENPVLGERPNEPPQWEYPSPTRAADQFAVESTTPNTRSMYLSPETFSVELV